ncbi:Alpha/Beta hydrolase protein [Aspergillus unguis]
MPSSLPRPPYDPELEPILRRFKFTPTVTTAHIEGVRKKSSPTVDDALAGREISHEERTVLGSGGSSDLKVSIFRQAPMTIRPASSSRFENRPGIFYTHGGGMIAGNRFLGIGVILDWVEEFDMVCVSIEYRIPPEHPDPTPIEDCYAGLKWTSMNAKSLGINPDCLMIAGSSAGGGLAAGTALLARDRGGPLLYAQVLICPMLDDRNVTVSSQQYVDEGTWSRDSNQTGWKCLLGERCGQENVSIYAAPSRATDLSKLPPAFIDVGTAEVFRDEAVAYATLLWKSGVQAELHVWSGGFHGFDLLAPNATLSINAREARSAWVRRLLSQSTCKPPQTKNSFTR